MQQLQTADTFGRTFALAKIADYRSIQAEHRDALNHMDDGIRHLEPRPGGRLVDITQQFRQQRLDAIADLERWVKVWERDLTGPD